LHTIIGVGNTFVDTFLEWIEETAEQLHPVKCRSKDQMLICSDSVKNAMKDNEKWFKISSRHALEDDDI
jgi:sulfur transfer complex TusBCD TusB component (DsrH family)